MDATKTKHIQSCHQAGALSFCASYDHTNWTVVVSHIAFIMDNYRTTATTTKIGSDIWQAFVSYDSIISGRLIGRDNFALGYILYIGK
ncbi:hypothetical protein CXP35_00295 [Komagataeibacter xylinus]|nr:hypothetical protein CXP35_00005 [Komagataeibacter xylinus]AZV37514.1 hypothetical protein CXP35_00295 [Komagataeibacter xylinus]